MSQAREFAEQRERGQEEPKTYKAQPGRLHQAKPEKDAAFCDTFVQERQVAFWSRVEGLGPTTQVEFCAPLTS